MYELSPSILSADFNCLGEQLALLEREGCRWVHIDVMDGMFAPSISYGMPVIQSIRKNSRLFFDIHMMVEEPGRYVQAMKESGADLLTVHAEACTHLDRTLSAIREVGMKAAVALNPATPLEAIRYVYDKLDMVLQMTVNPGFGGQSYIPAMTEKIRELRKRLDEAGYQKVDIEVDGGVNQKTLDAVLEAGASIIVAGSAVFKGDISANIARFREKIGTYAQGKEG